MHSTDRDLVDVAARGGLPATLIESRGPHLAKVDLAGLPDDEPAPNRGRGRYVLVTAVTPTAAGEGKSVTTLAAAMGLRRRGLRAVATLRQSSLGPTFGRKGGGAGGGRARLDPLDVALLGVLPDLAAVELAANLLAAMTDNAVMRGQVPLAADQVTWRRAIDVNDRGLRRVLVAHGGGGAGIEHAAGFDVAPASEVMGVLAMARDLADLRRRLGAIVVGLDPDGRPVTAEEVGAAGAMAALLRDAARPSLMSTLDGTPALLHAGPFANVSVGVSSVIADRIALRHADVVVTEAGFGADLGAEKFMHLKVPGVGRWPEAVVLVTTVAAMRHHGGAPADELDVADPRAVEKGTENLVRHLENLARFGVRVVVATNRHPGDEPEEIDAIRQAAEEHGARVAVCTAFLDGPGGALELADAIRDALSHPTTPRALYRAGTDVVEVVDLLARKLYGAGGTRWSSTALDQLATFRRAGFGNLPPCIAKTPASLSHDAELRGAPSGFEFPVEEVRLAAGAGYLTVLAGPILTLPGLPERPRACDVDLDEAGRVTGLV